MRIFLLGLVLCLGIAAGTACWYWSYTVTPSPGRGEVILTIPKGLGVRGIGALLADRGLLRNDIRFLALVRVSGLTTRLQAGEYSIPLGLTPPEVLQLLKSGKTLRHRVTIPEGMNLWQTAAIFARDGWVNEERFIGLARDTAFAKTLGIDAPTLEGYLFPETYTLVRHEADEKTIIRMMTGRLQQVWKELEPGEPSSLNRHEALTLASIVEKETARPQERPLIAGVFRNRLSQKMRLQSDPTVSYGIKGFQGPLAKKDLNRPTPYNTYVITGLPPGPICNPGREAIKAALHPLPTDFLYFVSRNDGSHVFSRNLEDHNRAVQAYQRK